MWYVGEIEARVKGGKRKHEDCSSIFAYLIGKMSLLFFCMVW